MSQRMPYGTLAWFQPQKFWTEHHKARSKRLPDTLQWLRHSPQFRRWLDEDQQVLIYVGEPVTGKTIAVSLVIDILLEKFGTKDDVGIAFLYSLTAHKRSPEQLLQNLLYQLGRRISVLPAAVKWMYRECEAQSSQATVVELLGGISVICTSLSKVYFVFDDIHSWNIPDRQLLFSGLLGLQEVASIKLFATSRPHVLQGIEQYPILERDKTAETSDMAAYVADAMRTLPERVFEGHESRTAVERAIVENLADSYFSVLPILNYFHKMVEIEDVGLQSVGPDEFDKLLLVVENLHERDKNFIKTFFAWKRLAKRPLKEAELSHVLRTGEGFSGLDKSSLLDVISCAPFVKSGPQETEGVSLSSDVASGFLQCQLNTWCPDARAIVARTCLAYLAFDVFSEGRCRTKETFVSRSKAYPFYKYAAQNWTDHLHGVEDLPEKVISSFLLDQNKVASARQMATLTDEPKEHEFSQEFDDHGSGLHLAAQFGLSSVVTILLANGERPTMKDSQGRTPLWCATENGKIETMRLLSSWDRISFTLMLNMGRAQLAHSLLQCTGQTIRDSRSRTPLHIGVIRKDMELIRLCIAQGLDINAKDMDGLTPIHLAIADRESQVVELLLDNGASTELIVAEGWSQAFGKAAADIVMLVEDANGKKRVEFLAVKSFQRSGLPITDNAKRLLIYPDHFSFVVDKLTDPEATLFNSKMSHTDALQLEDQVRYYSVVASVPDSLHRQQLKAFDLVWRSMRMAWTMILRPDSSGKEQWTTVDYFSTLTSSSMPVSGMAFFDNFVKELRRAWLMLCDTIDIHLRFCRPKVLGANGESRDLINLLLLDAATWTQLRRRLHCQIEDIRNFHTDYFRYSERGEAAETVSTTISDFARIMGARFDNFDADSLGLIQLEFNLTSIREAQKSTTLNTSLKRLTWVTFIFLPLTFVAGLFGMNVNVLEANPPWWWYLVFTFGILSLTMIVWVLFKRRPGLENELERKLSWLVKPRRKKNTDVETG